MLIVTNLLEDIRNCPLITKAEVQRWNRVINGLPENSTANTAVFQGELRLCLRSTFVQAPSAQSKKKRSYLVDVVVGLKPKFSFNTIDAAEDVAKPFTAMFAGAGEAMLFLRELAKADIVQYVSVSIQMLLRSVTYTQIPRHTQCFLNRRRIQLLASSPCAF